MRRRRVLARASTLTLAALLLAVCAGVGAAATITPDSGTLEVNIITPISIPSVFAFDVRGTMLFLVSDPGPIGFALLTDMLDLATPAPFPNALLLGINAGFTQWAALVFDSSKVEFGSNSLTVPATGIPGGSVTDPALSAFLGPLLFGFTFDGAGSVFDLEHDIAFLNFDLVSVAQVSAPASLVLLALGMLATRLAARRRCRR